MALAGNLFGLGRVLCRRVSLMLRGSFLAPFLLTALGAQTFPTPAPAGYNFPVPTQVAPGQIITLFARGLLVPNATASGNPWPAMLGGVTVVVENPPTPNYPLTIPIFSIFSSPTQCAGGNSAFCNTTAVMVQVPFEPVCIPTGFPDSCNIAGVTVNFAVTAGGSRQEFPFFVAGQSPHVLNTCDVLFGNQGGSCTSLITHANGTAVSTGAPARPGEVITMYAVGLGTTQNGTKTGEAASAPDPVKGPPYLTFAFWIDAPSAAGPTPRTLVLSGQSAPASYAGLVAGFVGLYQINLSLPGTLPSGFHVCQAFADTNLRIFLGSGPAPSQANESQFVDLCVAP